jgi:glycosyltransferase involved in cell wall biosynthesis
MTYLFIANTAWYLKNFRSTTLREFSLEHNVICLFPEGGDAESLRKLGVNPQTFYLDAISVNPLKELFSILTLLRQIARHKPDVVFSFNPKTNLYALIACWVLRIPCVPNVSGVGVASQLKGIEAKVYRTLVGFFYKYASHIFFQNSDDYHTFFQAKWIRSTQTEILPGSGVNLRQFFPSEKEDTPIRFLMAARLIRPKGVVEFIEAAREMVVKSKTPCEFILAGINDTSSRAIPAELLASLETEAQIHFVGHIEDMPSLLKNIDCVVLPSYYPEGVPRSLIEAAAAGKVIITTNTPGCREVVVDGENGFFVEPRSVESLKAGMQKVMELSLCELTYMKAASRVIAEKRFDENIVIQRYLEVAEKFA